MPEPVRPRPRMSLPARASGMVAAWIGKGAVTPFCASLRTMPSGSPSEANVMLGSASSAVSSEAASSESSATGTSSTGLSATGVSSAAAGAWATTASAAWTTSMFSTSFSGMTVWSELEIDMRNAKPSGVSARARNSVFSQFRPPQCGPATARESTRHTALFCVGAGHRIKRSTTIRTLPPFAQTGSATNRLTRARPAVIPAESAPPRPAPAPSWNRYGTARRPATRRAGPAAARAPGRARTRAPRG